MMPCLPKYELLYLLRKSSGILLKKQYLLALSHYLPHQIANWYGLHQDHIRTIFLKPYHN